MKPRVFIRRCESYDADKIGSILNETMHELNIRPTGKVMLKPNAVIAKKGLFPHAFTRGEFLDGALQATISNAETDSRISVGERSGITVPTRFCFKHAGYSEVIKKHDVKTYYFDEHPHQKVKLTRPENLRPEIFIPKPVVDCDFLINLPKFKAHPWTLLTLGMKNYIGLQDDRHRLVDHNQFLEKKIADLQDVIQPKFIAIDAITAGQRFMLTPDPYDMGVIIMGDNSCAVDAVACQMVNVNPENLIHLNLAHQRGFGPIDLNEISVEGDVTLDEMQHKTRDFQFCLERIDQHFPEEANIRCTVGKFPENISKDYCWGGCPGALQESMNIFKAFDPDVQTNMKPIHLLH